MIRQVILEILRARTGEWCLPQALGDQAFVGLSEVASAIEGLRQNGYGVEEHPRLGYRLAGTTGRLVPYEIERNLGTSVIGKQILSFDRIDSTQDTAWAHADTASAEGLVILAEEQEAGRGRMGRQWVCPAGKGLLLSVVLRPKLVTSKRSVLTVMAAVAVARAIHEAYHLPALIRWPNDIFIRGRKVGGILVEARALAVGPTFVVGIGLNTSLREDEFPHDLRRTASSLAIETGRPVDRIQCARALLRSLDRWYRAVQQGQYGLIAEDWRHLSCTLGQRVVLSDGMREYRGRVLDLTLTDGLILRLDSGVTHVFPPARVTLKQEGDTPA